MPPLDTIHLPDRVLTTTGVPPQEVLHQEATLTEVDLQALGAHQGLLPEHQHTEVLEAAQEHPARIEVLEAVPEVHNHTEVRHRDQVVIDLLAVPAEVVAAIEVRDPRQDHRLHDDHPRVHREVGGRDNKSGKKINTEIKNRLQ